MSIGQVVPKETILEEAAFQLAEEIKSQVGIGKRMAFISGNFNVVHPGHLSLLNFAAECADVLVVGVNSDLYSGTSLLPEHLRLQGIQAIGCVDIAVLLPFDVEKLLNHLKHDIVVKGKEYEDRFNSKQAVVESYGGRLLFTAGESSISSLDLLRREFQEVNLSTIKKPNEYLERHHISVSRLCNLIQGFANLKVVVLGD